MRKHSVSFAFCLVAHLSAEKIVKGKRGRRGRRGEEEEEQKEEEG